MPPCAPPPAAWSRPSCCSAPLAPTAAARGLVDDVNPFVGTLPGAADFGTGGGRGQHLPRRHHAVRDGGLQPRHLARREHPVELQLRRHAAARLLAHPLQRRGLPALRRRAAAAHHRAGHPLPDRRAASGSMPALLSGDRSSPRAGRARPLPPDARPGHAASHRERAHGHHAHRPRALHLPARRAQERAPERRGQHQQEHRPAGRDRPAPARGVGHGGERRLLRRSPRGTGSTSARASASASRPTARGAAQDLRAGSTNACRPGRARAPT